MPFGWSVGRRCARDAESSAVFVLTDLCCGCIAAGSLLGSHSRPVPRATGVHRDAMGLWRCFGYEAAVAFAELHLRTAECEHAAQSCSFLLFAPGGDGARFLSPGY